jgi:hypothetical protein
MAYYCRYILVQLTYNDDYPCVFVMHKNYSCNDEARDHLKDGIWWKIWLNPNSAWYYKSSYFKYYGTPSCLYYKY